METATSKVNKIIWERMRIQVKFLETEAVWFPRRVRRRWPAIILAERRMARVPGRITFLIDSINTIKDIRADGVPCGTRWANICLEKLTQPTSIKDSHIGRARVKVTTIWLVLVKIYGNKPIKLLVRIKMSKLVKTKILPGWDPGPKRIFTSENKVVFILETIIMKKLGATQKINGTTVNKMNMLNQLDIMEEEQGSKLENRLFIMFIC
jgi:hypothetical protein